MTGALETQTAVVEVLHLRMAGRRRVRGGSLRGTPGVGARFHRRFVVDAVDGGVDFKDVLRSLRRSPRFLRRFLSSHCAMKKVRMSRSGKFFEYLLEESKEKVVNGRPADGRMDQPLVRRADTD